MLPTLTVRAERWPIAGAFTIARGAKTEAEVVVVELADGAAVGRGECVPYGRYGETLEGVAAAIEAMREALQGGLDRQGLQAAMPEPRRNDKGADPGALGKSERRVGRPRVGYSRRPAACASMV